MLRKRLGLECIEMDWNNHYGNIRTYYKIPSSLIIPEGCRKIGGYAFCCCDDLREVIIPESVEKIFGDAFCHCWKATIILKKPRSKFKEMGWNAFCNVKDVKEEIRS